jgi:predicted TIM-barrel fold metal-dependent hydrolase
MKRIGVDAHCHIFNASDLPAAEFTATVVLGLDESLPPGLKHLAKALTKLAVKALSLPAPTGKEEIKVLNGGSKGLRGALVALSEVGSRHEWMIQLGGLLEEFLKSDDPHERELAGLFLEELGVAAMGGVNAAKLLKSADHLSAPFLPLARNGLRGAWDWISALNDFLWFLRCHRYSNGSKMFHLYGGDGRVNLIAPALIDYEYWLRRPKNASDPMDTRTPLEDQVKVMQVVNQKSAGSIHAYAPYDPLRDVEQKGRALRVAQEAVRKYGFIGVKLYPPMGFQAWGNEGKDFYIPGSEDKKWRKSLGKELDANLRKLYEWCVAEEVPILVHSNSTVLSRSSYADRPSPKHWGSLLETSGIAGIENLRVLMGHFGGFGDQIPNPKTDKEKARNKQIQEWTDEIVRLCLKFPNIYADLSYHDAVLEGESRIRYAKALKDLVTGPASTMKRKLCYGSDWVMLARQPGNEFYRDRMEDVLSKDLRLSDDETADILGHNALRFLGLHSKIAGAERLNGYYRSQKIKAPFWWESAQQMNLA